MAPAPVYHEETFQASMNLAHGKLGTIESAPTPMQTLDTPREGRTLSIYHTAAGYDLQEELDFLSHRAMEPNVFFSSRFLAPAMPRLDDREIRLAIIRDEDKRRSRLRMLMPFSIEKPGFSIGTPIIRVWANPFGPLGTPLVDAEGAAETIDHMLEALGRDDARLPLVLVMPDLRLSGPFAKLARAIAVSRNLPIDVSSTSKRPMLESLKDGDSYLRGSIKPQHMREMRRQWAQLEKLGEPSYSVARQPGDIRARMEEFLLLEASGWKGKKRSAMLSDRYRAAFAREAINNLAEIDGARIHTIDLDGKAIASMIVLIMNGEAYTWKTAYDENFARFSPGKLLVAQLTDWHLDDANIVRTDSCAVADHPIMSRFWQEREEIGTLVIGLRENSDRETRQAATQLHLYKNTRNVARLIREKIMSLGRKG
ncbi:GNAT family N-acetyltransferase [Rhizobium sp. KVB221]|uniref:GNAT family N-acetyltransferase n=1 Tax=Rhizobium setariae TaxID=2801340 RepID=A0A937CQM5_9HYPH|nr:GNAT family N-acetyltransferase [Rhizobium setariae]MBL0374694.1 GNAT family N-acetyltransferase [Rhizobium setariae]